MNGDNNNEVDEVAALGGPAVNVVEARALEDARRMRFNLRPPNPMTEMKVTSYELTRRGLRMYMMGLWGIDLGGNGWNLPWNPREHLPTNVAPHAGGVDLAPLGDKWTELADMQLYQVLYTVAQPASGIMFPADGWLSGVYALYLLEHFFQRSRMNDVLATSRSLKRLGGWKPSMGAAGARTWLAKLTQLQADCPSLGHGEVEFMFIMHAMTSVPSTIPAISDLVSRACEGDVRPDLQHFGQRFLRVVDDLDNQGSLTQYAAAEGLALGAVDPKLALAAAQQRRVRVPKCFRCDGDGHGVNTCTSEAPIGNWQQKVPESLKRRLPEWEAARLTNKQSSAQVYSLASIYERYVFALSMSKFSNFSLFIYDTGCTANLVNDSKYFVELHPYSDPTSHGHCIGNGKALYAAGYGTVRFPVELTDGSTHTVDLPAQYVPNCAFCLFGRAECGSSGYHVVADGTGGPLYLTTPGGTANGALIKLQSRYGLDVFPVVANGSKMPVESKTAVAVVSTGPTFGSDMPVESKTEVAAVSTGPTVSPIVAVSPVSVSSVVTASSSSDCDDESVVADNNVPCEPAVMVSCSLPMPTQPGDIELDVKGVDTHVSPGELGSSGIVDLALIVKTPQRVVAPLFHRRLVHVSASRTSEILSAVDGLKVTGEHGLDHPCGACQSAKSKQRKHHRGVHAPRATRAKEVLHFDLFGTKARGYGGAITALLGVDDLSGMEYVSFLQNGSGDALLSAFKSIRNMVNADFPDDIPVTIWVDKQLYIEPILTWAREVGWCVHKCTPYEHGDHGKVERPIGVIWGATLSILKSSRLPFFWWPFAMRHVVYVLNRLPRVGKNFTPYECVHGMKPDLSNLRVFGCLVHAHQAYANLVRKGTGADRTRLGIYLGPNPNSNYETCSILLLDTREVVDRRSFVVDESVYPSPDDDFSEFRQALRSRDAGFISSHPSLLRLEPVAISEGENLPQDQSKVEMSPNSNSEGDSEGETEGETEGDSEGDTTFPDPQDDDDEPSTTSVTFDLDNMQLIPHVLEDEESEDSLETASSHSGMTEMSDSIDSPAVAPKPDYAEITEANILPHGRRDTPTALAALDGSTRAAFDRATGNLMSQELKDHVVELLTEQDVRDLITNMEDLEEEFAGMDDLAVEKVYDPTPTTDPVRVIENEWDIDKCSPRDAELWRRSQVGEWTGIVQNDTFDSRLYDISIARKLGCVLRHMWVFVKKGDGRLKSRLTAQGQDEKGHAAGSWTSPTITYPLLFLLLIIGLVLGWDFATIDVDQAFLKAMLDRPVFMYPPKIANAPPGKVLRINRSIYGLGDAAQKFYLLLSSLLREFGLQQSKWHPCIFFSDSLLMGVFVDDCPVLYRDTACLHDLRSFLKSKGLTTTMEQKKGRLLGMGFNFDHIGGKMELDFHDYTETIIHRFDMTEVPKKHVPLPPDLQLPILKDGSQNHPQYREAVGCLLHLCKLRWELNNAVRELCKHADKNGPEHWNAMKHLFGYLRAHPRETVSFNRPKTDQALVLEGYTDASWADDRATRRGTNGSVLLFAGNVFFARSRTQKTLSNSSCESELMALSEGSKELQFFHRVLKDINLVVVQLAADLNVGMKVDSQSALSLLERPMMTSRSKHIDLRRLGLETLRQEKKVAFYWVPTDEQLADSQTKNLGRNKFERFRTWLQNKLVSDVPSRVKLAATCLKKGCQYYWDLISQERCHPDPIMRREMALATKG